MKKIIKFSLIILLLSSCSKAFLEEIPNSGILTPSTKGDFQRLLDNINVIGNTSMLPQLASDEYYINSESDWLASRSAVERNSYIWDVDIYGGEGNINDWNEPYESIFYANNIIFKIEESLVNIHMDKELSNIYGQALFLRAKSYFDLLKNYSVPYNEETEHLDLGVPLRINPSIDYTLERATVKDCYDLIFSDLEQSLDFLQFYGPIPQRNRATKLAVFALLTRIHHYRREYKLSEKFADNFLEKYNQLIDYNTISITENTPFSRTNEELIMFGTTNMYNNGAQYNRKGTVFVDSTLIKMYKVGDLRLAIYFSEYEPNKYIMKRGYNGGGLVPFNGFAVDEVLLNKVECLVRRGQLQEAATKLNFLLVNRYKPEYFEPVDFLAKEPALDYILEERRKELVWRCLRWDDIKRLNMEGAGIILERKLGDHVYTLEPNSSRYTFNIPQDEINRSGLIQNKRK